MQKATKIAIEVNSAPCLFDCFARSNCYSAEVIHDESTCLTYSLEERGMLFMRR